METAEELKKKFIEKYQPEKGHLNMARNFWNGELDELLESYAKERAIEFATTWTVFSKTAVRIEYNGWINNKANG